MAGIMKFNTKCRHFHRYKKTLQCKKYHHVLIMRTDRKGYVWLPDCENCPLFQPRLTKAEMKARKAYHYGKFNILYK